MTTTVTIPLTIDATVAQDISTNRGTAQFLSVYTGSGDTRRIFAHGVRSFPLGARIVSAKLRARQQAVAASASRTLIVRPVTTSWKESTITWSNQPEALDSIQASVTLAGTGSVGRVAEWDVTEITQRISDGAQFFGFRIHSQSTSLIRFFSQESGQGLEWVVEYSTAPPAPNRLSPSGGRAVSLARPTLSFGSSDPRGSEMTGFRVQLFDGVQSALVAPGSMAVRMASFNVNGVNNSTFASRLNGLAQTIVSSGAKVIGLQELSANVIDQPSMLLAKVKEVSGSNSWALLVIPNLNAILYDASAVQALWPLASSKGLGDGKWAGAMLFRDIPTDTQFIFWTTHYLTSDELTKQIAHTRVLLPWLASLVARYGVGLIGSGDFNAKNRAADRPMGMFALAGHTDVRDLLDPEEVVNGSYNSLDSYGSNGMNGWWIDHLLVFGGPRPSAVGLVDSGVSSDHNLIYATLVASSARTLVAGVGEPTFDTGERDGTIPQWVIERDVEVDEVLGFRAQVRRGTEWSEWSDVAFFTRVPKPVLTIVNPAVAPDDFVTESTPPFIATLSAGTQTAYRILVTDPVDHTVVLWDSKRQGKPDLTVTPSEPLGLVTGQRYRVEWQSEDDVVREATPGDPIPTIAEREFGFELSASVNPVGSITVTQPDERPWARVGFTMSTASDAVEVLRDGVSLGIFLPGDLFVSGTSYAYIDRQVSPQIDHVWEVRRIVNGVTSQTNPTDTFQTFVQGAWLCSEDGQHAFVTAVDGGGGPPISWEADEDVELHRPLGGRVARPVTHGIFGRQGNLAAEVVTWSGQNIHEARAAVTAMRPPFAPYGTPMILTQVDEAVRVFWVGVVTDRRHEFEDFFSIKAELHEVPDGVA